MIRDEQTTRHRPDRAVLTLGALSGALAGLAALAVAGLVPAAVRAQAAPVTVVGGFVIAATATAAAFAGTGALGRALNASHGQDAVASRGKTVLPASASTAPAVPKSSGPRIPGASAFTTPDSDFYRADTALVVPEADATSWRLRIHGKGVRRPLTLCFQDLLRREPAERDITLTCVSNEAGGPCVGNARWTGVPGRVLPRPVAGPPSTRCRTPVLPPHPLALPALPARPHLPGGSKDHEAHAGSLPHTGPRCQRHADVVRRRGAGDCRHQSCRA